MSLAEVLPTVRSLSRNEQIELMRLLASDLDQAETSATSTDSEFFDQLAIAAQFDFPRPGESYEAAAILRQFLESENAKDQ
jgi:hypothetical protein